MTLSIIIISIIIKVYYLKHILGLLCLFLELLQGSLQHLHRVSTAIGLDPQLDLSVHGVPHCVASVHYRGAAGKSNREAYIMDISNIYMYNKTAINFSCA